MRKRINIDISIIILVLCLCLSAHSAVVYLREFTFDEEKSLRRWDKMILNGEVDYTLIMHGDDGYIRAFSDKTCSALYHRIGFRLKDYPLLSWKWRVLQFPDISQAKTEEDRDDYAARIYLIFPFLSFSTSKFLEYVWSEDIPAGTILESPYGANIKIIVAREGKTSQGEWVNETYNVYEDYVRAFGKEPNMKVGAIAVMCDADSSGTLAEALFDDIFIEGQER